MSGQAKPEIYQYQTFLTATSQGTELFDALEEMPTVLRATCVKALDHPDAATFVIADRRGLAAWKAAMERAQQEAAAEPPAPAKPPTAAAWKVPPKALAAAGGVLLLALLAWLAIWLLRR
ncbi:MAG: hypothetical protein HY821_18425 [Acidobacteria bacterium]|nr:hypothetical protein [Acidobacteriota bacterium]